MYSSEAKGGMASLAELAKINFGGSQPARATEQKKKKERRAQAPSEPAVETPPESESEASPEAAASPAESSTVESPAEPEAAVTENVPEAQAESLPVEVAPESGEPTGTVEDNAAVEASSETVTQPDESADQQTEGSETAEESETKSA
jgi:hypothetical protein